MSSLSVPESRSARPAATAAGAALPTPWFTRQMPGAIEAERDRRREWRATRPRVTGRRTALPHPRVAAAHAAQAGRIAQARIDCSRWVNEGGRYDAEGAARLRIGGREMKRLQS